MQRLRWLSFIIGIVGIVAIAQPSPTSAQKPAEFAVPRGLPPMRYRPDNPLTKEKVALGRQLYFDARLSSDNTISCASCHDPKKGWSNGEQFATGVDGQKGGRNAPTIINAGYQLFQFWDGRAKHVEGQAMGPVQNPIEMNMKLDEVVSKLSKIEGYRKQFDSVFGGSAAKSGGKSGGETLTSDNIARAIAAFERTILSGDAPFDRFKAGDKQALSDAAQRGMEVFFNKAQCSACHAGPNFTDGGFHNVGVGMDAEKPDLGRFVESKLEGDKGSFKTPTLREIAKTAPYMHDGSMKMLEDVVEHYNKGGIPNPQQDEEIFPLKLTDQQKSDLIVFLKEGLSSESYPEIEPPALPK